MLHDIDKDQLWCLMYAKESDAVKHVNEKNLILTYCDFYWPET